MNNVKTKKIDEKPKITDIIRFDITTPDENDCLTSNPYKIDSIKIYLVEKDFLGDNFGSYELICNDVSVKRELDEAKRNLCINHSQENLDKVRKLTQQLESKSIKSTFYYKDRSAVKVFGNERNPAWLSTDQENSVLKKSEEDGKFILDWMPEGNTREGDYFICWTWTPYAAGSKKTLHLPFYIYGDPSATSSIPTHQTADNKYEILLERYLPEMYKMFLCENDLTPETTLNLNKAVAEGFTIIENQANHLIDLFDSNALHESLLMHLSNLFNLKLKSSDPTLWRRQIKEAIPTFKKKGTFSSIKEAFSQANIDLISYQQYWQIKSSFFSTESFKVEDDLTFELDSTNCIPPDEGGFLKVWISTEDNDYVEVDDSNIELFNDEEKSKWHIGWIGEEKADNPIFLPNGSRLKIKYQTKYITVEQLEKESYLDLLPLLDSRNEFNQEYPLKNWNTRLIHESDPMFDVLIPTKHPFHKPVQFGMIRTDFAYGENIYNMEEYNGSNRPSFKACDISQTFIDPCSACLSSTYDVDLSVQELSNDRMVEAKEILSEYMPFHAQLHNIKFSGEVVEYIPSPIEKIDFLINYSFKETHLSGQSNPFFNRIMPNSLEGEWVIDRQSLTNEYAIEIGLQAKGYNSEIKLLTSNVNLKELGLNRNQHYMKILHPSSLAGEYTLADFEKDSATLDSNVNEPLDQTQFNFELYNLIYQKSSCAIEQIIEVKIKIENKDNVNILTNWDRSLDPNILSYKISFPSVSNIEYDIDEIVNSEIYFNDHQDILEEQMLNFIILDGNGLEIYQGQSKLELRKLGKVSLNDSALVNHKEIYDIGDLFFFQNKSFLILSVLDDDKFVIKDFDLGDMSGVRGEIRRKVLENSVGQFVYSGTEIETTVDLFDAYNVQRKDDVGSIENNNFMENYMIRIGSQYMRIIQWSGTMIKIEGKNQNWMTRNSSGTNLQFDIIKLDKKQVNVRFHVFDSLDRSGKDPVVRTIDNQVEGNQAITILSSSDNAIRESTTQTEQMDFIVQYKNGNRKKGIL